MIPFSRLRAALVGLAVVFAAACTQTTPPAPKAPERPVTPPADACPDCPPTPPTVEPPVELPTTSSVRPGAGWRPARWDSLPGWSEDDAGEAWPAFRESCRVLARRAGWQSVCAAANAMSSSLPDAEARRFFEQRFTPWQAVTSNGATQGLITGYYEPLIYGNRQRTATSAWPVYGTPDDMLALDFPDLKASKLRGRLSGKKVVPYWTRAEISRRGAEGTLPARVLLWADDPIELFFLQVQGSGQVELPDGSRVRLGFADHNGQTYRSIGTWLIERGELSAGQASMQGIQQWARSHPNRLDELLNVNPRYVFFREMPQGDAGPTGALGVPLTGGRSIAVDPAYIPLGAPVFLATTWPLTQRPLGRLMMAQDTGSAIKGGVRADFFWGFGAEAGAQAGKMKQQGQMWVLLPK